MQWQDSWPPHTPSPHTPTSPSLAGARRSIFTPPPPGLQFIPQQGQRVWYVLLQHCFTSIFNLLMCAELCILWGIFHFLSLYYNNHCICSRLRCWNGRYIYTFFLKEFFKKKKNIVFHCAYVIPLQCETQYVALQRHILCFVTMASTQEENNKRYVLELNYIWDHPMKTCICISWTQTETMVFCYLDLARKKEMRRKWKLRRLCSCLFSFFWIFSLLYL